MESITSLPKKRKYLQTKAQEIASLKRRFEQELQEISATGTQETSQLLTESKDLLKEADSILSLVPPNDTKKSQEPPFEMDKKSKLTELLQYGFEVKYLPLARYLQTAPKYISTATWCAAREEFRLARVFEKYLELRNGTNAIVMPPQQALPPVPPTNHDALLQEALWMSADFKSESTWKREMAAKLAREARDYLFQRRAFWTNTKATGRFRPVPSIPHAAFFKTPTDLCIDVSVGLLCDTTTGQMDTPEGYCSLGDVYNNSSLQNRSTSMEYQLGTLAAFSSPGWFEHEDVLLMELTEQFPGNWPLIAHTLNLEIYCGKVIRGPAACQTRFGDLKQEATGDVSFLARSQLSSAAPPLLHPILLEKHNLKFGLMRGAATKIITPRSIVPKKISFNVHPSHEAAARKANQNISKLLTPSELAQRRLQRTRLINEAGALGVPSLPRSTPSPSAPVSSQFNNPSTNANNSGNTQFSLPSSLPPISSSATPSSSTASGLLRPPMKMPTMPPVPQMPNLPRPPQQLLRPPAGTNVMGNYQHPSQQSQLHAQAQAQHAQLQQMYAKAMAVPRPPPTQPPVMRPAMPLPRPPTSPRPAGSTTVSNGSQSPKRPTSPTVRTSPRKNSNK